MMAENNQKKLPLIVDLDGTLLATDTLYESFVQNFFSQPIKTLAACLELRKGKAALKTALSELGGVETRTMPKNSELVAYLEAEKANGRSIHLVTAAHQTIASQISQESGLFESATGSSKETNLKSSRKAEYLKKTYPDGFVYAGDDQADLPVWRAASAAIPVGVKPSVARSLAAQDTPIEARIDGVTKGGSLRKWLKALRLHQWSKNILLFVPIVLSHSYDNPALVLKTLLGFIIMGLVASGTYILNDLSDLSADRQHSTKHRRPFAAGAIAVQEGFLVMLILIVGGVCAAFALQPLFGAGILLYLVTTLSYSLWLKLIALLDVFILSLLYAIRVLLGLILVSAVLSAWLLAFSFFFFYSMSLAKRHVELIRSDVAPNEMIPGRGYKPSDWPLTLNLGGASAVAAIIVIVLYLTEEAFPSGSYSTTGFLWAAPVLIALWVQRIWLLAHRGDLDDDPVAFAVKDPVSIALGITMALFVAAAILV